MENDPTKARYAFGPFRFDLQPYRLVGPQGSIEITPQQAQLLELLVEHRGQIVSREQIRARLWPPDVHVDFDRGINFCVTRLRAALGDPSAQPRYIETVPRRGYRFVACLDTEPVRAAAAPRGPSSGVPRRQGLLAWLALALAASVAGWSARLGDGAAAASAVPAERAGACSDEVLASALGAEASDALELACWHESRPDREARAEAIAAYEAVLVHHPNLVPVLARLAQLYQARGDYARAEPLAVRALRLAPASPAALHALAETAFRLRYDWPAAERLFRRAMKRAPRDQEIRMGLASLLAAMGRADEAIALAEETASIDPLFLAARTDLAQKLYLGGRYGDAIDQAQRVVSIDPKAFDAHRVLQGSHLARGDPVAALAAVNRGLEAWGWGPAGAESLEAYAELALEHQRFGSSVDQAQLSSRAAHTLAAGRLEEARRLIERACAERSGWTLPSYDIDPRFAPFHQFPGLASLDKCLRGPHDLGRADTLASLRR